MISRAVPCRVCGKMFVPCNKTSNSIGAFNYRSVACSLECGTEYLRRVQLARQKPSEAPDAKASTDDKKVNDKKNFRGRRRELKPVDEWMGEG